MADKTAAMQRLSECGLPVPVGCSINASNVADLRGLFEAHSQVEYWYLRFEESLADGLPRVASTGKLAGAVSDAVEACGALTVIVQQRITARTSGVMAVLPESLLLVEHVDFELGALLREGVTPGRALLSSDGSIMRTEMNEQEFYCSWHYETFLRTRYGRDPQELSSSIREQLALAAASLQESCIVEWIENENGEVVFLDHRRTRDDLFAKRKGLEASFETGLHQTLPYSAKEARVDADGLDLYAEQCIARPLFEYVDSILPVAAGLRIAAGGVLAHLCVRASEVGIPCLVTRPGRARE